MQDIKYIINYLTISHTEEDGYIQLKSLIEKGPFSFYSEDDEIEYSIWMDYGMVANIHYGLTGIF